MDGVFMKKLGKRLAICVLITALVWVGALLTDRQKLNQELIRLHVVANSDSPEDQAIKLQVRDAIRESLSADLAEIADTKKAYAYIQKNLPKLQSIANQVLREAGVEPDAVVNLCRETFGVRYYDTFRLPSGVYNALRITIGDGMGKNWWCVVFPTLCDPATVSGFDEAAVEAGFGQELASTLSAEHGYEIRFFLLDAFGKLENMLFTE